MKRRGSEEKGKFKRSCMKRVVLSGIFAMFMVFAGYYPVQAAAQKDEFAIRYEAFYEHPEQYHLYNTEGNDIKEVFLEEHKELFEEIPIYLYDRWLLLPKFCLRLGEKLQASRSNSPNVAE